MKANLIFYVNDQQQSAKFYSAVLNMISPIEKRNWGDFAGYSMDPDGHVIAFAKQTQ